MLTKNIWSSINKAFIQVITGLVSQLSVIMDAGSWGIYFSLPQFQYPNPNSMMAIHLAHSVPGLPFILFFFQIVVSRFLEWFEGIFGESFFLNFTVGLSFPGSKILIFIFQLSVSLESGLCRLKSILRGWRAATHTFTEFKVPHQGLVICSWSCFKPSDWSQHVMSS